MPDSYNPLRPYNFTFVIRELEDQKLFTYSVKSVQWSLSPKVVHVVIRIHYHNSDVPVKCPWWKNLFRNKKFTGELSLGDASYNPIIVHTFYGMKLKNQEMTLDYSTPVEAIETPIIFTYEKKEVE